MYGIFFIHQVALVEASIFIFTVKGKSGQWIHQTFIATWHTNCLHVYGDFVRADF